MRPLRVLQVGYFERKRLQRRWFNTEHKLAQGLARADHVDISFMTTADSEALRRLAPREGSIAFPPNPVDPSVETARVFDIPASARQSTLYDDGVVEFASRTECAAAMADLWHDDGKRRRIGETGWRIARSRTNSTRVARYLCEAVFRETFSEPYEWPVERR